MKDQDYQLFEAYLAGDLSESDVKEHLKRLENDQEYRESFELYKSLNEHLKNQNEEKLGQFKDSVSDISKNYFESRSKPKFGWVKMALAASIVIAIGLYFILGKISKPQYEEIAQIPTIHLTERSADNELYSQAENAFNQEQYEKAIGLFEQILKTDNQNQNMRLYLAIAYMENDDIDNARKIYDEIIQKENAYSEEALWYAALNELKDENYAACQTYLAKIKPSASRYKEAQELIGEL